MANRVVLAYYDSYLRNKKNGVEKFSRGFFGKRFSRSLTENGIKIQRFDHLKYVRRIADGALTEFAFVF